MGVGRVPARRRRRGRVPRVAAGWRQRGVQLRRDSCTASRALLCGRGFWFAAVAAAIAASAVASAVAAAAVAPTTISATITAAFSAAVAAATVAASTQVSLT